MSNDDTITISMIAYRELVSNYLGSKRLTPKSLIIESTEDIDRRLKIAHILQHMDGPIATNEYCNMNLKFENNTTFANDHEFGMNCEFGDNCIFGSNCRFLQNCKFGKGCIFGEGCIFGGNERFGNDCIFGRDSVFKGNEKFGSGCIFKGFWLPNWFIKRMLMVR